MKPQTYEIEEDVRCVFVGQVDHEGDEDEENPYSGGFNEDPQDGLQVNKVNAILT